jgi:hypothetical protein
MESIRIVNGWEFEWDEDNELYECRGSVYYDDEHDEIPEPSLWKAALELEKQLRAEGYNSAEAQHSEKGWVEVVI